MQPASRFFAFNYLIDTQMNEIFGKVPALILKIARRLWFLPLKYWCVHTGRLNLENFSRKQLVKINLKVFFDCKNSEIYRISSKAWFKKTTFWKISRLFTFYVLFRLFMRLQLVFPSAFFYFISTKLFLVPRNLSERLEKTRKLWFIIPILATVKNFARM